MVRCTTPGKRWYVLSTPYIVRRDRTRTEASTCEGPTEERGLVPCQFRLLCFQSALEGCLSNDTAVNQVIFLGHPELTLRTTLRARLKECLRTTQVGAVESI